MFHYNFPLQFYSLYSNYGMPYYHASLKTIHPPSNEIDYLAFRYRYLN
jgi:hypothetical protein